MVKIDDLDRKILETLKDKKAISANATYIAKKLNKPVATVHSRIKRLEKYGIISKFVPVLRYEEKEKAVEGFLLMQIHPGTDANEIAADLSALDEIVDLYLTVGEWCFIAKLRANNMDEYTKKVQNIVKNIRLLKIIDILAPKTYKKEF